MLEKATITDTVTGEDIPVLFNPEEYTLNKDINYAQTGVPGLSGPITQFVHGNLKTLEMELFLDTYEAHRAGGRLLNQAGEDVRKLAHAITGLMDINPETHAPPVLLFTWASLCFTCVLASVNQRFTMFLPDGTPVRARLQVTFNEFRNAELEAKETKLYVVRQGETLSAIAQATYSNPALWRPIALRNEIDDARTLPAGLQLVVPALPFRDPESGEVYQ
jgi:hypothetical protein